MAQENTYWLQRSKVSWMKDGDRNSKFFHAVASQRKRRNEIQKLQDSEGRWHSQQPDLERVASEYFQAMFTSASTDSVQQVISHVCEVVSPEMNDMLLAEFSHDEVKRALFQMHPTKAPCPAIFRTRRFTRKMASAAPSSSSRMKRACAPGAPMPNISRRRKWRGRSTIPSTACRSARSTASRNSRPRRARRPKLDLPWQA